MKNKMGQPVNQLNDWDHIDVNPANYLTVDRTTIERMRRNQKRNAQPNHTLRELIINRCAETNDWPKTINDLIEMGFEVGDLSPEEVAATLDF
jgi:hypothetical protein